ncbi:HPP family protein [Acuticoccus sediminis]|uniref:HPP family protein n=1 Tax=Acuticoccus sediminis TaxID=2184697 RepID=UPI001CFE29E4|nr:HPP family protein [Acuticoccus sediminis]
MNTIAILHTLGGLQARCRAFLPAMPGAARRELGRASFGAFLGILLCATAVSLMQRMTGSGWFLVAPLGATAVLVFAVPNSPLAQPWSAVVGNFVSAVVALAVVSVLPAPWAPAVAVGGAIFAMMLVRALHPPGGAVALLTAIEAASLHDLGMAFPFVPVAATTAILVMAAIGFNRWTGRVYPFRQAGQQPPAQQRIALSTHELQDLLLRFNQTTNLGVADLGRLIAAAEQEAAAHRFDGTRCADIMTETLITVSPETPLTRIAWLFQHHPIKSLPVVDDEGTLLGLVLQGDLVAALTLGQPLKRSRSGRRVKLHFRDLRAEDVMQEDVPAVSADTPAGLLLDRLATQKVQVVPVLKDGHLAGIITRSDLIRLQLLEMKPAAGINAS